MRQRLMMVCVGGVSHFGKNRSIRKLGLKEVSAICCREEGNGMA